MTHVRHATCWRIFALVLLVGGCARTPPPNLHPAPEATFGEIVSSVIFIGDAGKPHVGGEPVFIALAEELGDRPESTLLVWLGDNIYSTGMPDSSSKDRAEMERRIDAQIDVADSIGVPAVFLPGNHDWAQGGRDGWANVLRQERHIAARGEPSIRMLPGGGCPGPAVVDVGDRVRLIALDTQWWLHGDPKPTGFESPCGPATESATLDSLRAALESADERHVLVAGHHPFRTSSKHDGYFPWTDYVFPLREIQSWMWLPIPVLGIAYPVARQNGITNQDISGSKYRHLIESLREAFAERPPLLYAAGHEHILEVLDGTVAEWLLVSGGGYYGHTTPVTARDETRYVSQSSGFMRVDVLRDDSVRLGVFVVSEDGTYREAFATMLVEEGAP